MAFTFRVPHKFILRAGAAIASLLAPAPLVDMTGSGGIVAGGTADFVFQLVATSVDYTPSGGIVAGGHADVAVGIDYVPTGGLVSGGFAYSGTPYGFTFEVGGPGFMLHDIVLAQRVDYDKDAARLQVYRVVGEIIGVDAEGESTIAISEGEEFLAEFGDGIEFVRVGNRSDTTRQGSIYLTSDDSHAPFMDIIDGVNSIDKLGTIDTIKARVGRLTGIVDADFGQLEGYGLFSGNVYLKGNMKLGPLSSISWANVTNQPSIPTLPGYVQSTYIDATEIRSPQITGNSGYMKGFLQVGDVGNSGILRSYGKSGLADGIAGFWLEGGAGGSTGLDIYINAQNYLRITSSGVNMKGDARYEIDSTHWVALATTGASAELRAQHGANLIEVYDNGHGVISVDNWVAIAGAPTGDTGEAPLLKVRSYDIAGDAYNRFIVTTHGAYFSSYTGTCRIYIENLQVLTNQQSAIANATDAASTMARLNNLLAACRTHGLIAT